MAKYDGSDVARFVDWTVDALKAEPELKLADLRAKAPDGIAVFPAIVAQAKAKLGSGSTKAKSGPRVVARRDGKDLPLEGLKRGPGRPAGSTNVAKNGSNGNVLQAIKAERQILSKRLAQLDKAEAALA